MQDIINPTNLANKIDTLPSIAALQNNSTITSAYVYISNVGFYYGSAALQGVTATPDNSIVVDKNGIRWIFQPQMGIGTKINIASQGNEAAVTTIITANYVFTGTGVIFVPNYTGNVKISLSAIVNNNTAGDGVSLNILYAPATALSAAGTNATGTWVQSVFQTVISTAASQNNVLGINNYLLTGLTLNTSYAFQPAFEAITGGTASYTQINITVEEF
jgi:hypothetical protein